ncbi:hypothetical protein ABO04_04150 [Nitrosomonas sp. HPC101]|uniref:hypothetical protein n=1 Tax=Nitrosomonas sp. HPC101 TaxID=1658667 RepID=UPI001369591C|nr:hypothetical protein [Nitrosomonas sp. HPC101]MXS85126.1 hypothetical protein [Nitrosomonas sp. HPC101]
MKRGEIHFCFLLHAMTGLFLLGRFLYRNGNLLISIFARLSAAGDVKQSREMIVQALDPDGLCNDEDLCVCCSDNLAISIFSMLELLSGIDVS